MSAPDHAETDTERLPDGWEDAGIVYTAGGCYTRTFYNADREVRVTYDVGAGPVGAEYFDPSTADEPCWGEFHGTVDDIDHDALPDLAPEDDDGAYLEFCYALMAQIEEGDIRRDS